MLYNWKKEVKMKVKLQFTSLIFILILVFHSINYGQINFIGGSFGLNLAELNDNSNLNVFEHSFRNGIKGGLLTEYKVSNLFLIRGEINYSMRGTESIKKNNVVIETYYPSDKVIQKLNYIEVPILFQYNLPINFILQPKVFAGYEISFLLNSETEYRANTGFKIEHDSKKDHKSTEYGTVFGIGTDYNIFSGKIIFDLRYYYGLSNISIDENLKITSNTISFNLGYAFSIL